MTTDTSKKIIEYIKTKKQATAKELVDYLSISPQAVFKQLKKLTEKGELSKIGKPPKVFYFLAKEKEVGELYIAGLTTEYCVKSTVLDALKYGFKTFVIKDAVEGIRQNEDDFDNAFEEMKKAGATIITSDDING